VFGFGLRWVDQLFAEFPNHFLQGESFARLVPDAGDAESFGCVDVLWRRFSGQDNDRQFFEFFFGAHPFQELQAGLIAEAEVGDKDVGKWKARPVGIHAGPDEVGAGFAGVAADECIARSIREGASNEQRVVRVVLKDEKRRSKILFHCGNRLACVSAREMGKAPEFVEWKG
jgi:hypothetical protein